MSKFYVVSATLNFQFTRENIQFLLQKASDFDFVYLADNEDKKLFNIDMTCLTVEQALARIVRMTEKKYDYGQPFLQTKYQDTEFLFWLDELETGLIEVAIGAFGFRWDKKFEYDSRSLEPIDFARYIRLLLSLYPDITILKLETFSDLTHDIEYTNQGCATILMPSETLIDNSINLVGLKKRLTGFIWNGLRNKFIFFDKNIINQTEPSVQECYDLLKTGVPAYLYAKKNNFPFKVEVKQNIGFDSLSVYPIRPYSIKKGYGSEEEKIDIAFYIQRLIELCENFAIYQMKTFF